MKPWHKKPQQKSPENSDFVLVEKRSPKRGELLIALFWRGFRMFRLFLLGVICLLFRLFSFFVDQVLISSRVFCLYYCRRFLWFEDFCSCLI